jgi:hypothetical protein
MDAQYGATRIYNDIMDLHEQIILRLAHVLNACS